MESPGNGVLTCSANDMESIGIKDAIKKMLHPMNDIEINTVNADGDAKGRNIIKYLYLTYQYYPKSVTNISNLSQTHFFSNTRHQHRCNQSIFGKYLNIYIIFKIEKVISDMVWEATDIDKYNIDPDYIGCYVVGDFSKIECTSHILKNFFKKVKTVIESVGLFGTGKAMFSNKKIMQMTAGISRELM